MDEASLQRITENWGISDIGLFASATLQKTWVPGKAVHVDTTNAMSDLFDRHVQAKEKLKSFLKDTKLIPRELIFVGRNMNCVRANNRSLGSPVNRINIMANWAVSSLGNDWSVWSRQSPVKTKSRVPWPIHCLSAFIQSRANYLFFRSTLWLTSVTFYATQLYQKIVWVLFGQKTAGFEGITDAAMKKAIQEQFGLEVDDSVFEG